MAQCRASQDEQAKQVEPSEELPFCEQQNIPDIFVSLHYFVHLDKIYAFAVPLISKFKKTLLKQLLNFCLCQEL
jgi:hypothetical protein